MTKTWRDDLQTIRRRTRTIVVCSAIAHLGLFLVWPRSDAGAAGDEVLLEIVWLDEPTPETEAAPAAPPAQQRRDDERGSEKVMRDARETEKAVFKRRTEGPVEPKPQRNDATRDLVRSKLASLEPTRRDRTTRIARVESPTLGRALASALSVKESARMELVRADRDRPHPSAENRRISVPVPENLARATLVQPAAVATARPDVRDPDTVRHLLDGLTLNGAVAERPIVSYRPPAYPDWAKMEAVEGSVRLRFTVLPDGGVKRNVLVEKTSGFEDFDRNATVALLEWKFEPLTSGATGEQGGTITLNYRLDDTR